MLELSRSTVINTDAAEIDLRPGEYRDANNISLIANALGGFTKGTTYGNIDTGIRLEGLLPNAVCLGTALDPTSRRAIITFFQKIPIPFSQEYKDILNYAESRGFRVPSPEVQLAQNLLIALMKAAGIWTSLDVFYVFKGDGDENFAKINWKLPNDATLCENTGMTYVENVGFYNPLGQNHYLDTKFIPSAGVKYTLNNCGIIEGHEDIVPSAARRNGVTNGVDNCGTYPLTGSGDTISGALNCNAFVNFTSPQFSGNDGVIFLSRPDNANLRLRKNTSTVVNVASPSSVRPALSWYLGAFNNNGVAANHNSTKYTCWGAGENIESGSRQTNFWKIWNKYVNSFIVPLKTDVQIRETLMYLFTLDSPTVVPPLVKSSLINDSEESYLDGYAFVNDLFYFNFRNAAPKVINIQRALDSPGFYNAVPETSLTIIKPHPPLPSPVNRVAGGVANASIQRKPFQFMTIYHFLDGEQSVKSPVSEFLNSLDDRQTVFSTYDSINVKIQIPIQDYQMIESVELFVRNSNNIGEWRGVQRLDKTLFARVGTNFEYTLNFKDNLTGSFLPLELATKLNDAVPINTNYLSFIENRLFAIDTVLDYDLLSTWQLKIDLDPLTIVGTEGIDDREINPSNPLYTQGTFMWDSEYTIGLAFYDKYGRKYPSSANDRKLITPKFTPAKLPLQSEADGLPNNVDGPVNFRTYLRQSRLTAKVDLRAAGNIAAYGKPPSWAYWWGLIRSKNTTWEFQIQAQCILRFPYSLTKWPGLTANLPANTFLEDDYLYWDTNKLLDTNINANIVDTLVNDYIDIVVPPNFPYPIDNEILIDFAMEVTAQVTNNLTILDRDVVEIFSNKIRIRGDRGARWFRKTAPVGVFRKFPKYVTGVDLTGTAGTIGDQNSAVLLRDETKYPIIFKRRRKSALQELVLYDTPSVFPVVNAGTTTPAFQNQTVSIQRVEFNPLSIGGDLPNTIAQGSELIQPFNIAASTVATNHAIKILWGPNNAAAQRLLVEVSIYELNDEKQPIRKLYSATENGGVNYHVGNSELIEYQITGEFVELTSGWYGYGVRIIPYDESGFQLDNPEFDLGLEDWLQSQNVQALWNPVVLPDGNAAFVSIAELNSGYSRSLYQRIPNALKTDIQFSVVVDAVGIEGPASGGPITLNPGNTNDATEELTNASRLVVPYPIDCDSPSPRTVTLSTLKFTLTNIVPVGSKARAELWTVDQTTGQPVAVVASSVGAFVPLSAPGQYTLPFAAGVEVNTTGKYGMAVYFEGPAFADFANKDYANGQQGWVDLQNAGVQWTFADRIDESTQVYQRDFSVVGGVSSFEPMGSTIVCQPVFFDAPTGPDDFSNLRIRVNWGDNSQNLWNNKIIKATIYPLDQGTKLPLVGGVAYSADCTVRSLVNDDITLLTSEWEVPSGWYGMALEIKPRPAAEFADPYFNIPSGSGPWLQTKIVTYTDPFSFEQASVEWLGVGGSGLGGSIGISYPNYPQVDFPISTETTYLGQAATIGGSYKIAVGVQGVTPPDTGYEIKLRLYGSLADDVTFELIEEVSVATAATAANPASVLFSKFKNTKYTKLWITFVGNDFTPFPVPEHSSYSIISFSNIYNEQIDDPGPVVEVKTNSGSPVASLAYGAPGCEIIDNKNFMNGIAGWKIAPGGVSNNSSWRFDQAANRGALGRVFTPDPRSQVFYQEKKIVAGTSVRVSYEVQAGQFGLTADCGIVVFDDINDVFGLGKFDFIQTVTPPPNSPPVVQTAEVTFATSRNYIGIVLSNATGNGAGVRVTNFSVIILSTAFVNDGGANPVKVLQARVDDATVTQPFPANFFVQNLGIGQASSSLGQRGMVGTKISVQTYIYEGSTSNDYTVVLTDGEGNEIGRTLVSGQALNAVATVQVSVSTPPTVDGLFIRIVNEPTNTAPISVRVRNMTNIADPPLIQADSTPAIATWLYDQDNSASLLTTGSVTVVDGAEDVPQPAGDITIVMADAAGNAISAPQTFPANAGKQTIVLSPTLSPDASFDYGIMVKNAPSNNQLAGTIRVHSVFNGQENQSVAAIITRAVDPGNPLYEAWKNGLVDGIWVRAGYVTNFVAVIDDHVYSAFTAIPVNPDCYHLVTNILQNGIAGHSNDSPTNTYRYGVPFPSLSSDPDSTGATFIAKEGQGIGDINIKQNTLKKRSDSNVIRWSDPIIVGSRLNSLNAFINANSYAVDFQRGPIQVMLAMHDHTLFCVHESAMTSVYVNRAIMISPGEVQDPQGDALFLTNKVVQNDNKLTSNLGTINPESCRVVESGTIAYGFDLARKSLWQKSNNGVRNLTYECNAKELFNRICDKRLKAYLAGEDVKVYTGYNEKTKIVYLTFAPFMYRGRMQPGITIGWSAYLNGFISRYSFIPISYVNTEDNLISVKQIEATDPDFFSIRYYPWLTTPGGGSADWIRLIFQGRVGADTSVPLGTRILNSDFSELGTYWNQYGTDSPFTFTDKTAKVTLPATVGVSNDLVNDAGAIGIYKVRIRTFLPIANVTAELKVYDNAGVAIGTLTAPFALTGDDTILVNQSIAGRIGIVLANTGPQITVNIDLFTTVVRTFVLYQPVPLEAGPVRVRLTLSSISGSAKAFIYTFNDPSAPLLNLIDTVDLVQERGTYIFDDVVQNPSRTKYIGVAIESGYDTTLIEYFDVNGVPLLWNHDQKGYNNQFYNAQYDSEISLIFNIENGQVRLYNSLGIKSNDVWEVLDVVTSNGNVSFIPAENFRLRDGVYYASFLRDILTPRESLPDPVKNSPILHGQKLTGVWMRVTLRNSQTFKQVELRAVYLGSDELAGHYLNKK